MEVEKGVIESLAEILDVDPGEITPQNYVLRDLEAESIDLMELAVVLNDRFGVEVNEDEMFLGRIREHAAAADEAGGDRFEFLSKTCSFLTSRRIHEILNDLDGGPVLKVADLIDYVRAGKK